MLSPSQFTLMGGEWIHDDRGTGTYRLCISKSHHSISFSTWYWVVQLTTSIQHAYNQVVYAFPCEVYRKSNPSTGLLQAQRFPGSWSSQFSRQLAHEGIKVASTMRHPLLPSRKYSCYSFLLETESTPRP